MNLGERYRAFGVVNSSEKTSRWCACLTVEICIEAASRATCSAIASTQACCSRYMRARARNRGSATPLSFLHGKNTNLPDTPQERAPCKPRFTPSVCLLLDLLPYRTFKVASLDDRGTVSIWLATEVKLADEGGSRVSDTT